MSVEEANFALGLIANSYDPANPESSVERIRTLTLCLMQTPESFWEQWFALCSDEHGRELRMRCEALAASGAYVPSAAHEQLLKVAQVVL